MSHTHTLQPCERRARGRNAPGRSQLYKNDSCHTYTRTVSRISTSHRHQRGLPLVCASPVTHTNNTPSDTSNGARPYSILQKRFMSHMYSSCVTHINEPWRIWICMSHVTHMKNTPHGSSSSAKPYSTLNKRCMSHIHMRHVKDLNEPRHSNA